MRKITGCSPFGDSQNAAEPEAAIGLPGKAGGTTPVLSATKASGGLDSFSE